MAAPSGPGTHIREVIGAFENRGHQVVKLIAGGEEMLATAPIKFKKRFYRRFIPSVIWQTMKDFKLRKFDNWMYTQLMEVVKREKPDVIYERAYYLMNSGSRVAKQCGVRYISEINAPYPQEKADMEGRSWYQRLATKIEKQQVLYAHKVIVVSSALKKYLIERTNVISDKVIVTANAVNPLLTKVNGQLLIEIKARLNAESTDVVIGFVGSIFPYHGVDILLEAFIKLKRNGTQNIKLLIVGDGEILNTLKAQARDSEFEKDILFTGNISHKEVYTYIEAMDITVMARSNWYGSPVKIFEYGAMRKLVIAPNEIPTHDVMKHGLHGFIIEANCNSLAHHLLAALNNRSAMQNMAETFHQKVMDQYTWQQVGDTILKSMQ